MNWDDIEEVDELPAPPRKEISAADRELLQRAARALGAVRFEEVDGEGYANLYFEDAPTMHSWNPLQFGDDTFVLGARLGLLGNSAVLQRHLAAEQARGGDPVAAAKRAVVLAAAEIEQQRS